MGWVGAMRTPVIAGNWKCNMRLDTAYELASGIRERIEEVEGIEKIVCPPFIYLATVEVALSMSSIKVGAQDTHWEDDVAATGEVGPKQIEELCDFVIIGHSERRHQFGETDEMVNRKVKAALGVGLQPIMCVGELLSEREAGSTAEVLVRQTRSGLGGVAIPDGFIIAYEPVWAIGTGTAATAADAEEAIRLIRWEVAGMFGETKAETVRILYGGSVTPENIAEFMSVDGIDGALVGGASLKVDSFRRDSRGGGTRTGHNVGAQGLAPLPAWDNRIDMRRLIAIVGPTASGKTRFAIDLAQTSRRRDHRRRLAAGVPTHGHRHRQADGVGTGGRAASSYRPRRARRAVQPWALAGPGARGDRGHLGARKAAASRRRHRAVRLGAARRLARAPRAAAGRPARGARVAPARRPSGRTQACRPRGGDVRRPA